MAHDVIASSFPAFADVVNYWVNCWVLIYMGDKCHAGAECSSSDECKTHSFSTHLRGIRGDMEAYIIAYDWLLASRWSATPSGVDSDVIERTVVTLRTNDVPGGPTRKSCVSGRLSIPCARKRKNIMNRWRFMLVMWGAKSIAPSNLPIAVSRTFYKIELPKQNFKTER